MDKLIADGVKVDLILTDPPYGTTQCKWDSVIPFEEMWKRLKLLGNKTTPTILFGKQPFTSTLVASNIKNFKQELIWEKDNFDNPMQAKRRHLNKLENISIFYEKQPTYNPQGLILVDKITKQGGTGELSDNRGTREESYRQKYTNYPINLLKFTRDRGFHPTQKPVALLEYLIRTYSKEDDVILDFTMGSGSTGVACLNTNRKFIGIEKEEKYFNIAKERIYGAEVTMD